MELIKSNRTFSNWVCLICGTLPVSAIALHVMGIIDLYAFYPFIILLYSLVVFIAIKKQILRKVILIGWLSGIVAVSFYDLSRLPFIALGWEDFIPKIGGWLIGQQEDFTLGYLWRYAGNGGGLGITYFILLTILKVKKNFLFSGITYGLIICLCLDITLLISPNSENMMFAISSLSVIGGTIGHLVYGLTLGILAMYFYKKEEPFF